MIGLQPATFEEFEAEARKGNVIPVVRTVLADLQTPVGALLKIAGDADYSFLLESVEGGERVARYSFLGVNPELIVRGRGGITVVEHVDGSDEIQMTAIEFLRQYFAERQLAWRPGLPPFTGGAVGYLTYDAVHWFEPSVSPPGGQTGNGENEAVWMFYRTILAFDRVKQQIEIISLVFTDDPDAPGESLPVKYEKAVAETSALEEQLITGAVTAVDPHQADSNGQSVDALFSSNWTRSGYEAGVAQIKEHIAAGDCYQVVLSQRFSKRIVADPVNVYRALRATNPSPYMFFFNMKNEAIIGASPEMLVRCRGKRVDYRPIAGTRKRGATESEDWLLGEEMRVDEKEVAEHMMLVDLGRNDLGRVSDYGSVFVEELMSVERYSHVQHLVSSINSRLRDGLDRFDALASCFPAGTVSGAPKVSAMKIIQAIEPDSRGLYAGAVLYLDFAENLDSCIAIRTIVMKDGVASVQAGAGIVADSIPEKEYEECVNKARALVKAIEMAERGI